MTFADFFAAPSARQMADVMLDLETMGTRPNAPIVAVGAVAFDMHTLELGERYYAVMDLASSVALGSVIDASTVLWWLDQSDDARSSLTRGARYAASDLLNDFSVWLTNFSTDRESRRVWGCGPDIDCVLLSEHYMKAGIEVPWRFWNQRCYRTVKNLYPNVEQDPRTGKHNAVEDAVFQAQHLFKIRRTLRGQA